MREEKPDVQGRCHRAESGKFDGKTERLWESDPGPSAPQASTLPLRHHHYPLATKLQLLLLTAMSLEYFEFHITD